MHDELDQLVQAFINKHVYYTKFFSLFGLWAENLNVSGADSFKFSWEKR